MGPPDVAEFLDSLIKLGIQPQEGRSWKDVAVVDQLSRRPTAPCDWVHVGVANDGRIYACLKEHENEPGIICLPKMIEAMSTVN